MAYDLLIKRQAQKKLAALPENESERILLRVKALAANPDDSALDTSKLSGSIYWRLRVGGWRVIYDRKDALRIIAIEKIKPRGDAYK